MRPLSVNRWRPMPKLWKILIRSWVVSNNWKRNSSLSSCKINAQKEGHLRQPIITAACWSTPSVRDKLAAARKKTGKKTTAKTSWLKLSLCRTSPWPHCQQLDTVICILFHAEKCSSVLSSCLSVSSFSHRLWAPLSKLSKNTIKEWVKMTKDLSSTTGWLYWRGLQTNHYPKPWSTKSTSTFRSTGQMTGSKVSRKMMSILTSALKLFEDTWSWTICLTTWSTSSEPSSLLLKTWSPSSYMIFASTSSPLSSISLSMISLFLMRRMKYLRCISFKKVELELAIISWRKVLPRNCSILALSLDSIHIFVIIISASTRNPSLSIWPSKTSRPWQSGSHSCKTRSFQSIHRSPKASDKGQKHDIWRTSGGKFSIRDRSISSILISRVHISKSILWKNRTSVTTMKQLDMATGWANRIQEEILVVTLLKAASAQLSSKMVINMQRMEATHTVTTKRTKAKLA